MFKTVHFSTAFLLQLVLASDACYSNVECYSGWCEGGSLFSSGYCAPKRNDGEKAYWNEHLARNDPNSCKSRYEICGICGWKMSNWNSCSANSNCWSGRCDAAHIHCDGTCIEHDYIFNPSSNLVTYHDYNSCGPRGDDAQADLGQCQYGYRVVGAEKNDNYAVKARVNGCDYFAYSVYECAQIDTLSDGFCYYFLNRATRRTLDAYTSGDVHGHFFNGGNYQKWYAEMSGNNYMFKNKATGRYLDSNTAGDAYTHAYNGGNYQKWTAHLNGNDYYWLQNLATGRILDSNTAGDVYTGFFNGGKYQEWVVSVTPCS